MKKRPAILVTGASGYIGSRLTALLSERGWRINALVRDPSLFPRRQGVRVFRYSLGAKPDTGVFAEVDAMVHAAANVAGDPSLPEDDELDAAGELIDQAARLGIRKVIFLSSPVAGPDAASGYGRVKWGIERRTLSAGGVVVRIGLVYGGGEEGRGLFGVLSNAARRLPCLPAFLPSPVVQPIHIDDLCRAILKIIEGKGGSTFMYRLGQAEGVGFNVFLRNLAWRRHRRYPIALPVPLALAGLLVALGRALRLLPEYYSERLRDLQGSASMDTDASLRALGVALRPLDEGLLEAGKGRRSLLDEGHALIRYVSGQRPRYSTVSRYVRAMEKTRSGRSLELPPLYLRFPLALRCMDAPSPVREMPRRFARELAWRMNVAAILAETNPGTAGSFHLRTSLNPVAAVTLVVPQLVLEGLLRILAAAPRIIRRWLTAKRAEDAA